ncbi:hypothetical protein [Micromonospora aurantiaca (nom. illeg.)]|uniref:hypothetical protein n=1 Tax=Micromonospora aurantiaca (nom. illeg.) TaxID=47850 RepID=UPI0035B346C9
MQVIEPRTVAMPLLSTVATGSTVSVTSSAGSGGGLPMWTWPRRPPVAPSHRISKVASKRST